MQRHLHDMKVAVYTITKNEEQFIQRWAESAEGADVRVVVDTGSTDGTVETAKAYADAVHVISVGPWRFDDARNASLALVPSDIDICIALDADEVLQPGWREALEEMDPKITRPSYEYTWSWNTDGSPGLQYGGDKIHTRYGYRWRHPVHEVLEPHGIQEVPGWCRLKIHHHPDHSKSRSSYMPLLEQAVKEDPSDDRNAHYLAREYYYRGDYEKAAIEFKRHLALPKAVWTAERAKSMRLLATCEPWLARTWLLRACAEDQGSRENWIALAQNYHDAREWEGCYSAAKQALRINQRNLTYITEAWAWGSMPHDLAAIGAYHLGLKEEALVHGEMAVELDPDNERLRANLAFYRDSLAS